jgi:hypothetical protein
LFFGIVLGEVGQWWLITRPRQGRGFMFGEINFPIESIDGKRILQLFSAIKSKKPTRELVFLGVDFGISITTLEIVGDWAKVTFEIP